MTTYEARCTHRIPDGSEMVIAEDFEAAKRHANHYLQEFKEAIKQPSETKMEAAEARLRAARAMVDFFAGYGSSVGVVIYPICSECGDPADTMNLAKPLPGRYICIDCTKEGASR